MKSSRGRCSPWIAFKYWNVCTPHGNQLQRSFTKLKNVSEMWDFIICRHQSNHRQQNTEEEAACLILKAQISMERLELQWKSQESLDSCDPLSWWWTFISLWWKRLSNTPSKRLGLCVCKVNSWLRGLFDRGGCSQGNQTEWRASFSISPGWGQSQEDQYPCLRFTDPAVVAQQIAFRI